MPRKKTLLFTILAVLVTASYAPFVSAQGRKPAQGQEGTIQSHFRNAQKAQQEGDQFRAESEYRQSLGQALEQLGAIYSTVGDLDKAASAYKSASQATVDSEVSLLGLGVVYLRKGDYEKGVEVVHTLLAQNAFDPQARDLLGKLFFAMNRLDAAAQELEEATRLEPKNASASFTLAMIFLKRQQPEKAGKVFSELQKQLGDSARLHMFFGGAYRQANFSDEAVAEFQKAAEIDPNLPQVHYSLALAYLSQEGTHKFPQAIEELKQELARKPNDYLSNSLLGLVYQQERKLEEAIPYLEKATLLEPEKPDAFLLLGEALYVSGQQEKSIPPLTRAIELTTDPSRNQYQIANGHYLLGQALLRMGKTEEAGSHLLLAEQYKSKSSAKEQERLKTYLQNSAPGSESSPDLASGAGGESIVVVPPPPSPVKQEELLKAAKVYANIAANAYNQLGLIHASQSDFQDAAQNFDEAALWDTDIPDLNYNLGLAHFKAHSYSQAIAPLEKARKQQPSRTSVQALLGMSYFFSDDYHHALEQLRPLGDSGIQDPEIIYALGLSLLYSGDQQQGEPMLRELVKKFPQVADAHVAFGQALALEGDFQGASSEFSQALELDPAVPAAHYFAGVALLRQSKFKEAEEQFKKEIERSPHDAKSKYHLGLALTSEERLDEALRAFHEAVQLNPSFADAYYEIGKVHLKQDQTAPAIENLEKAVQLGDDKAYVQYELSQAYLKAGRTDAAETALARYRELKAREQQSSTRPRGTVIVDPQ